MNETDFISHALAAHPESQSSIEVFKDATNSIIKTEEPIENREVELEEKFNPWVVKSLEEFRYYCCPECPFKFVNKTDFIKHAMIAHPQSQSTIVDLEDNKTVIKTENTNSTNVCEPPTYENNNVQKETKPKKLHYHLTKKAVISLPKLSDAVIKKYTTPYEGYKCETCDKNFSHKFSLKRHVQSVHENVQYS